jgi:hypothetical protein
MEQGFYHTDSFKICHGFLCQVTEMEGSDTTGFWGGRKTEGCAYGWETHSTLCVIERELMGRILNWVVIYLYCCTVHFGDSLIIKNQQMHYYDLCLF